MWIRKFFLLRCEVGIDKMAFFFFSFEADAAFFLPILLILPDAVLDTVGGGRPCPP